MTCKSTISTIQEENIIVPKWFFNHIVDTLRIAYNNRNINDECCQDRNVRQALVGSLKLLRGEELSGKERTETPNWEELV